MNDRFARAGVIARVDLAHESDFLLGTIRVRPAWREICGPGWQEALEPRVMRLLVALARAKGEILSRDDLIESCWDGIIVGEDAINRCISRLRKAAEASGNVFEVETIPRVGYRLKIADAIQPVAGAAAVAGPIAAPIPAVTLPSGFRRAHVAIVLATLAVLILILMAAGLWLSWFGTKPHPAPPAPLGPEASVAVLPFANLSGDPAKDYLSEGFSEELLNDLSSDPRLLVTARSSAFVFKGRNVDTQSVARALHVRAIVEGSMREAGNRLRITAQLIDAAKGYNIWSASYDRDLADILAVQGEVARNITIALAHRIVPGRKSKSGTIDPDTYRLLLQGRQQIDLFTTDGYLKGYALLQQVVARAPDFAGGLAAFSRAAWGASVTDPLHYNARVSAAREAVAKALVIDPYNVEAREVRGLMEADDWNWRAATADFWALQAQSPNNMRTLVGLRDYYIEMAFWDAALEITRRARALDPLSIGPRHQLLWSLWYDRRYDEEIGLAQDILARDPKDSLAWWALCTGYAYTHRIDQARHALEGVRKLENSDADRCSFAVAANSGDLAGARSHLEKEAADFPDKFWQAQSIAGGYVEIGDFDKASDWYQRAYERRENFFADAYDPFGPTNIGAKYHQTARWKALTRLPPFREWQAEHDRIAVALAAHRGPL